MVKVSVPQGLELPFDKSILSGLEILPSAERIETIIPIFIEQKGYFGSVLAGQSWEGIVGIVQSYTARSPNSSALFILDGDLPNVHKPLLLKEQEALEQRLNASVPYVNDKLRIIREQLAQQRNGTYVRLGELEREIYNLYTSSQSSTKGYPGAWMLYYSQEKGLHVRKVEPILVVARCYACEPLFEKLSQTPNMEWQKEDNNISTAVKAGQRPGQCPNHECQDYQSGRTHGNVYKNRFFSVGSELSSIRLQPVSTDLGNIGGLKYLRPLGLLNDGTPYEPK